MFMTDEIELLGKYAYASPHYDLEEFLNSEEVDAIQDGGTRAQNLLQRIFVPKHKAKLKTIRISHLMVPDLQVDDWLLGLAECLRYNHPLTLNIGFSYLVWKPENKMRYVYAAKALPTKRIIIQSKSEFYDFAAEFAQLNDSEFLNTTFLASLKGNVFESSGFTPHTLVCVYCWLTK